MASDNAKRVRAARPTINVEGRDQPDLPDGLIGLTIEETSAGLYRCEAMFGNWGATEDRRIGWVYFDRRLLEFGKPIKFVYEGATLFEGRIMALEALFPETGLRSLTVLAEDRFQDLRMARRTRTFVDTTDAAVIRSIAGDHGLAHQVDLPDVQHTVLAQVNQSDLAFIRERARSVDGEVWMEGNALHAATHTARSSKGGEPVDLTYRQTLREFSALADLAHQRTGIIVSGWDVAAKQAITYEATESVIRSELNGDTSGVSILQSALGARKEQLSHTVPLTSQEAQNAAEAFFRMSARQFVIGRGVADVQPHLRAGMFVQLRELGPLFSGKHYVTEVRHVFDRTGLRTEFATERPGLGR